MEAVATTGAVKHANLQSNHHHQQTNNQLFTGWMPFLSPNQQRQSTDGNGYPKYDISSDTQLCVLSSKYWRHSLLVEFVSTVATGSSTENEKKSSESVLPDSESALAEPQSVSICVTAGERSI